MEAIILTGGLGTRLRSRLKDRPKAMALVGGRPFLELLFDRLIQGECDRIILSVGYLRDVIIRHFGSSYRDVPIDYVIEEAPLGTGGAIRLCLPHARGSDVVVMNGDTFLDINYRTMFAAHQVGKAVMTMAVAKVLDVGRYGGVLLNGDRIAAFTEKGNQGAGWINAGVYVLRRDFPWPASLGPRFSFEQEILHQSTFAIQSFLCHGFFLDIGIPEDLDRAQTELKGK
jgi:D-glycero-alpha-D-manno-heptose 1-phosphate guanylyltransferase